jgi:hypothetical protein
LDYTEARQEAWNKWLEGKFSENVTSYQQLWNFTTHSIHIPNEHPDDPPISLEILQGILRDHNDFEFVTKNSTDIPECFHPRLEMTQKLVDCGGIPMARPIINLGFPKDESTTLFEFFKCVFKGKGSEGVTHSQTGQCNREVIDEGRPALSGCKETAGTFAFMQMDINDSPCAYPQISMLDEIYQEHPNATSIFTFCPINDWIASVDA